MNDEKIDKALKLAISSAEEAGKKLMKYYGNIETQSKTTTGNEASDVVTQLDREIEEFLAGRLRTLDPDIGFRGEEFGVVNEANTTWLVDPIDGTSHFVRGLPFCTTMISLIENGAVIMSVIYDFVREDAYWAVRGQGAYKNGVKINVSSRPLGSAFVSFETRLDDQDNLDLYQRLSESAGGMISTMNSGAEFIMVATGKIDARITKNPYGCDWDFAPGTLLVEEAGGIVRNHNSDEYDYKNHDFIAANKQVYEALTDGEDPIFG